jgi:hypothetical protein
MKIYHFLKDCWAKEAIKNRRLKVSQFDQLNDPFELSCFNLRNRELRAAHKDYRDGLTKKYGMVSFSADYRNPLMWGHYADRHRGVCLGFEAPEDTLIQVKYQNDRLKIEDKTFATEKDAEDLLSIKYSDWCYEKEWRLMSKLEQAQKEGDLYFEPFSKSLQLCEINLGFQCPSSVDEYGALVKSLGIDLVHTNKLSLAVTLFGVTKTVHVDG